MAEPIDNDDPKFALVTLETSAAPTGKVLQAHIEAFGFSGLDTLAIPVTVGIDQSSQTKATLDNAEKALEAFLFEPKHARYAGFILDRFFARAAVRLLKRRPTLGHLSRRSMRTGAAELLIREADGTLAADDLEASLFEALIAKREPLKPARCERPLSHAVVFADRPVDEETCIRRERALALLGSLQSIAREVTLVDVSSPQSPTSLYTQKLAINPTDHVRKDAFHGALRQSADLIVNASRLGTSTAQALTQLDFDTPCLDSASAPLFVETSAHPIRTRLFLEAERLGLDAVSGFDLEIERAKAVIEAFLCRPIRASICATIERDIRLEAENIVLIGMPGCGKTTIGKILAQRLMRRFVDVDELVAQQVGKIKARIYREDGEAFFREKETEVIRALAPQTGLVISTGGGSCLKPVNRMLLGMNGRFIWLKRPLAKLATRDRPIAIERGVATLYEERAPIYASLADREIEVTSIAETVALILGEQ